MSGINKVEKIDEFVKIQNVLISVSDKSKLDYLVTRLLEINHDLRIFSTGGTYTVIKKVLEENGYRPDAVLTQVSDYTGQPETQGGLVKTLDFKIYLGILTETYNEAHQADLARTGAVPIDMVVCNLYPFTETIAKPETTIEMARGNIDIGGPCMIRAAAKNFLRVVPVVDPETYPILIDVMEEVEQPGSVDFESRFELAKIAFRHTAQYDLAIVNYLNEEKSNVWRARKCYGLP